MPDQPLPQEDIDKIKENLESVHEVNKAIAKKIASNKCPKCHNNLEKISEKNENAEDIKFGYFTYWKCPVCGWNTRIKVLSEDLTKK